MGHLTPSLFEAELTDYRKVRGSLPLLVAVHTDPRFGEELRQELVGVSRRLDTAITIAEDGMRLRL